MAKKPNKFQQWKQVCIRATEGRLHFENNNGCTTTSVFETSMKAVPFTPTLKRLTPHTATRYWILSLIDMTFCK